MIILIIINYYCTSKLTYSYISKHLFSNSFSMSISISNFLHFLQSFSFLYKKKNFLSKRQRTLFPVRDVVLIYFLFRKKPADVEAPPVAVFRSFERSSLRSSMRASIRGETLRSSMIQRSSIRSRKSVNAATETENKWTLQDMRPWFSTYCTFIPPSLLSLSLLHNCVIPELPKSNYACIQPSMAF